MQLTTLPTQRVIVLLCIYVQLLHLRQVSVNERETRTKAKSEKQKRKMSTMLGKKLPNS